MWRRWRPTDRRRLRLNAKRHLHETDAQQIGVPPIRRFLVGTPGPVGQGGQGKKGQTVLVGLERRQAGYLPRAF